MSIAFSCEFCGKKIEAPDNAAGKWGKCPSCHSKLYVPNPKPSEEDDELKLAPVDETEIEKQKRLLAETYRLTKDIMSEKEIPDEPGGAAVSREPEIDDERLTANIITYLRQMADGELDSAENIVNSIITGGEKSLKILNDIAHSEIPEPELADIPRQVLSGLIRTLRNRIG